MSEQEEQRGFPGGFLEKVASQVGNSALHLQVLSKASPAKSGQEEAISLVASVAMATLALRGGERGCWPCGQVGAGRTRCPHFSSDGLSQPLLQPEPCGCPAGLGREGLAPSVWGLAS